MQQLRLFPREQRLGVVLLDDGGDDALAVLRRLRRSRGLDAHVVDLATAGSAVQLPGNPGLEPAAVIMTLDSADCDTARVGEVVATLGAIPLIVVVSGRGGCTLEPLQAGAEDVLTLADASVATLERAVLSAVHRRMAGSRTRRADVDVLTGVATRAALQAELPGLLGRTDGQAGAVAVLYCDLDKFKVINDTHGHAVGDRILVEAAARLRRAVRSSDLVVRIGGDEFVVVIAAERDLDRLADEVARRVVDGFDVPFEVDGEQFGVSVSVGLAIHRPGEAPEDLVARADRALYLAKQRGKARVARYDEQLDAVAALRETSAGLLREGMRRSLLTLDVQPVVPAGGQAVFGHLYRAGWGGAPMALGRETPVLRPLEVAREAGCAPALFRWTLLGMAGADAAGQPGLDAGRRRWVEIPRDVLLSGPGRATEVLAGQRFAVADKLVVVVDEADVDDSAALRAGFLDLARHGVRVALGRFGSFDGSLNRLERHHFETVWLDRDMVEGIAGCPLRRAKLAAVSTVAAAVGAQLMAERPVRDADSAVLAEVGDVLLVGGAVDLRAPMTRSIDSARPRPASSRVGPPGADG